MFDKSIRRIASTGSQPILRGLVHRHAGDESVEEQIVETSGQSVFRTEGFEILPAGLHIHKGLQGSSATLGIRPEDV
ncbi:MAG: hypothetical protein U0361_07855 [Nitrospiraceae bacterium]